MTSRKLTIFSLLFGGMLLLSLGLLFTFHRDTSRRRSVQTTNPLVAQPNMVDHLDFYDTPATLDRATMQHVTLLPSASPTSQPATLVLSDQRPKDFPRSGTWLSDVIETDFAFTELIPSWNLTTPKDTGVFFQVKTRDAQDGAWSPWLYIGHWGRAPSTDYSDRSDRIVQFDRGIVQVDNLTLDRPASAYQLRATLLSFTLDHAINPSIRRISVSYSGVVDDPQRRAELAPPIKLDGDWAQKLNVPFRSQGSEAKPLAGQICSPTSTSMVMAFCGVDRPTEENALAIYDDEHDMFGNWGRAVQRAGELGLDAWLRRFRNWDQVKEQIAAGQPVIAAIKFKRGEFPSALFAETEGHLIVIRGFTKEGNVIVNDPADRKRGDGVVYKADELAHAWFGSGGVGYIIHKVAKPPAKPTTMPVAMKTDATVE